MATEQEKQPVPEPRGFGEHTRGLSGEYAHEQGWGLNVEERQKEADGPQNTNGGNDYEYGARDFGDEPVNTAIDAGEPVKATSPEPEAATQEANHSWATGGA